MNEPNSSSSNPSSQILAAIYRHVPVAVVVLALDGKVTYANPAAAKTTGFSEREMAGENFWRLLFPGKLFAQVPKFISCVYPASVLANDVVMVLRTKAGAERVVAWSRILQDGAIILFGADLTDRLNAAENADLMDESEMATQISFGPSAGNAGTVEGEIITPIAISPPILPCDALGGGAGGGAAIQQVHDFLININERVEALQVAFSTGEMANLAGIAANLGTGAHACGLLDFSERAEQLHAAAAKGALEQVSSLVRQIVLMVRPDFEG